MEQLQAKKAVSDGYQRRSIGVGEGGVALSGHLEDIRIGEVRQKGRNNLGRKLWIAEPGHFGNLT